MFQLYHGSQFLLVEETRESGENHQPAASHWQILSYKVYLAWAGFKLTALVVIGTNCIGCCKFNYHTITTTMAPVQVIVIITDLTKLFYHLITESSKKSCYTLPVETHLNNVLSMIYTFPFWTLHMIISINIGNLLQFPLIFNTW
jgi:hypothetical protein